jgi:molybdopterin synthase sulfur carrier subunit
MEIILFGQLADIAGAPKIDIEIVHNIDELRKQLERRFPRLAGVRYMVAVNKKMISGETTLQGDEAIALMPPFSGG